MLILRIGNLGNFSMSAKRWHSGSHALAWAAITTFMHSGFPRTSNSERGIAVPRFSVESNSL